MTAFAVTPETVYAAIRNTCSVYAADKPVQESRVVATEACDVSSLVVTKTGLFWTLVPLGNAGEPPSKTTLAWLPTGATRPVILDATLDAPTASLATLGDDVYINVADGILRVDTALSRPIRVLTTEGSYGPTALRGHDGTLYFHDGYETIFSWRPGESTAKTLVERAGVMNMALGRGRRDEAFAVDASGLYWIEFKTLDGGWLDHAALAGGKPEKLLELTGTPRALATDDGAVYWTEADSPILPEKTTIRRTSKSALSTSSVIASLVGAVEGMQIAAEGLYLAASPSLSDFDFDKLGFKRYGGPLLILPRDLLDRK